ncbi:60S ribosomal protein L24 [Exophiala oligosperma]
MRTYDDTFSATKIYPGKGKLYVRGDSKVFRFQNGKTESLFLQRKNPRRIAWTMLYRRMHKKGISEPQMEPVARLNLGGKRDGSEQTLEVVTEVAKKRSRRTVKHQRAIVGASLDVIKERRSQRPEARAAARQAAIKESKEQKAAAESKKKAEKAKSAAKAATGQVRGGIASKQQAKGKPTKVQATSR